MEFVLLVCGAGAVITVIIGIAWGGWTTFSATQTRTQEVVLASQAAICVAQFMKEPNLFKKRARRPHHGTGAVCNG